MWPNQRERCSLQALHLMSQSIENCNSEVFWELCMCCQHDEHSHNIYVTTTTKNRSKKCFRGFKVCSDYEHTTNGGNSLPYDVLMIISKEIIEDPKHQET